MIKKGFTLAEVLITLVIIGVIAALTIPSFALSHRNKVLKTQFYKALQTLEEAARLAQIEIGIPLPSAEPTKALDTFYKHMGISTATSKTISKFIKRFDGTRDVAVRFYYTPNQDMLINARCGTAWFYDYTTCIFHIDTNGDKGPDRWGYDLFSFQLYSGYKKGTTLRAGASSYTWQTCNCTNSSYAYGGGCGCYALNDVSPDDPAKKYWDNLK